MPLHRAPPLQTSGWLNTNKSLDIPDFRGRGLIIEAFQMLAQAASRTACRKRSASPSCSRATMSR